MQSSQINDRKTKAKQQKKKEAKKAPQNSEEGYNQSTGIIQYKAKEEAMTNEGQTAHAYLRVSTAEQDTANQWAEIAKWAADHGLPYPVSTHDTASTKTEWRQRKIGQLIKDALPGDTIIIAEVSRLARSILEVLEILKECAAKGVAVHVVKSGLILDGSLPAKITVTILALAAEIERDLIRARTKSALAEARAKGKTLGRPVGTVGKTKIDGKAAEIERMLSAGVAKTAIARLLGVSRGTVDRYTTNRSAS